MKKPTIAQIKRSEVLGPYFLSPSTMMFFKQRLSDFKTEWQDEPKGILRVFTPWKSGHLATQRLVDVSGATWKVI